MAEIKNQASGEIELLEMTENNSSNKQTSKSFNMIQVQKKKDSLELFFWSSFLKQIIL